MVVPDGKSAGHDQRASEVPNLLNPIRRAAFVDADCAVITPTDANPVSSRATGLTMINKRIMPYCITMLCGNVVCMMGAESGFSGYYSAINPQLQVDLLNTTTMPLRFVTGEQAHHGASEPAATGAPLFTLFCGTPQPLHVPPLS